MCIYLRRSDKEIQDAGLMQTILDEAPVCRLGMCRDNIPYVVPMNFAYRENAIYLHAALEGKKLDILRENLLVCFEIDLDIGIVPSQSSCEWGTKYYSIIGWGDATFIEDAEGKAEALDLIMEKYAGRAGFSFPDDSLGKVIVIKIRITGMTGKKSGY
jgi:nitroimidazol reductase NimA-like FMN-containing flavoprotein (pyridoxamine 5'-phosphate oxidase superfamily)